MRLALIADVFPPLRSSGAVQLRDLADGAGAPGSQVTMLVASPDLRAPWRIEDYRGVRVVRLRSPRTRDMGFLRRTLGESLLPFAMLWRLRRSPLWAERWDGVAWYSPTIFLGSSPAFSDPGVAAGPISSSATSPRSGPWTWG